MLHFEVFQQFSKRVPEHLPIGTAFESRAPEIVAGNAVCQLLGTLFFFARVYSRLLIINSWKPEDSVLTVAWVFATAYSLCQYGQVSHGAGKHYGAILQDSVVDTVESAKYAFAAQIVTSSALALPKFSICLTYLRIFYTDLRDRRMIQVLIFIVLAPLIPFFFTALFQCTPIDAYWIEGRPASKCIKDIPTLYINGSLNVFVDVALMAIVLPRVLDLHVNAQQKWALVGLVGLGSFAAIAGIIRMVRVGTTLSKPNFDATWDTYDISIWTSTEIYVSLICASAPGIKPLVTKLLPKFFGATYATGRRTRTTGEPGSIELSMKLRRGTIGSARVKKTTDEETLDETGGLYMEVGRGVDRGPADGERKAEEDFSTALYKTEDVTMRTSVLR